MAFFFEYGLVLPVVFAAFLLKAMTGFGSAIVFVSLGSLIFPVQDMVIVCMLLEIVGNAKLVKDDWEPGAYRYWVPLCVTMMMGAAVGALLLKFIDASRLNIVMGVFVLCLGAWLFFKRSQEDEDSPLPKSPGIIGMMVTGFAGILSGLLGISGPPIVWYFGQRLSKENFRRVVVPIFLFGAVSSTVTYLVIGLLTLKLFMVALMCLPVLFLGMVFGSRMFNRIPEHRFSQIIGLVLTVVALKLLLA